MEGEAARGAGSPPSSWNLNLPLGITGHGAGNIWVADTGNNRVLRFKNALGLANGAMASMVIEGTQDAGGPLTDWIAAQNASGTRFYRVSEK